MLRSIRSRLVLSYLLVILLAMGVTASLAWSALDRAFLDVLRENLLAQARRVAQTVEAGDIGAFDVGFPALPYSQAANVLPGYHTRVIDDQGVVILGPPTTDVSTAFVPTADYNELVSNLGISPLDVRGQEDPATNLLSRPEVQSALNGEPATAVRSYSWTPQRRILYAAYPVHSPASSSSSPEGSGQAPVVSVVYVASPLPRLTLSLLPDFFGLQILGGAVIATLLAGLTGALLARELTRPLRQLTQAASALAQGASVQPVPPASTDELNALSTAFNAMNANLSAAHEALAALARQRQVILESLTDAVLATDATGEIVFANPAASALLEEAPPSLYPSIRRALTLGERQATEITVRDRVIELLITPLYDEKEQIGGAVAIGHDVTAHRQLDRLRTNFVSDVSHELRTPLTAIKGFVETLQDSAADDPTARDRFLRTIATETERLIRLTNDLLLLTRADAGRLDLHLTPTDLLASARRAAAQMRDRARDKQIRITIEPPDEPPLARADADRIHQVLINLLDNAVKFTPDGGQISIAFGHTNQQVSCTIADTGPGIPHDEIPHLFERFYRGNRSRARSAGESGAGLGLTIAKAIVAAHGGRMWVESEPGQGTRFIFSLLPAS